MIYITAYGKTLNPSDATRVDRMRTPKRSRRERERDRDRDRDRSRDSKRSTNLTQTSFSRMKLENRESLTMDSQSKLSASHIPTRGISDHSNTSQSRIHTSNQRNEKPSNEVLTKQESFSRVNMGESMSRGIGAHHDIIVPYDDEDEDDDDYNNRRGRDRGGGRSKRFDKQSSKLSDRSNNSQRDLNHQRSVSSSHYERQQSNISSSGDPKSHRKSVGDMSYSQYDSNYDWRKDDKLKSSFKSNDSRMDTSNASGSSGKHRKKGKGRRSRGGSKRGSKRSSRAGSGTATPDRRGPNSAIRSRAQTHDRQSSRSMQKRSSFKGERSQSLWDENAAMGSSRGLLARDQSGSIRSGIGGASGGAMGVTPYHGGKSGHDRKISDFVDASHLGSVAEISENSESSDLSSQESKDDDYDDGGSEFTATGERKKDLYDAWGWQKQQANNPGASKQQLEDFIEEEFDKRMQDMEKSEKYQNASGSEQASMTEALNIEYERQYTELEARMKQAQERPSRKGKHKKKKSVQFADMPQGVFDEPPLGSGRDRADSGAGAWDQYDSSANLNRQYSGVGGGGGSSYNRQMSGVGGYMRQDSVQGGGAYSRADSSRYGIRQQRSVDHPERQGSNLYHNMDDEFPSGDPSINQMTSSEFYRRQQSSNAMGGRSDSTRFGGDRGGGRGRDTRQDSVLMPGPNRLMSQDHFGNDSTDYVSTTEDETDEDREAMRRQGSNIRDNQRQGSNLNYMRSTSFHASRRPGLNTQLEHDDSHFRITSPMSGDDGNHSGNDDEHSGSGWGKARPHSGKSGASDKSGNRQDPQHGSPAFSPAFGSVTSPDGRGRGRSGTMHQRQQKSYGVELDLGASAMNVLTDDQEDEVDEKGLASSLSSKNLYNRQDSGNVGSLAETDDTIAASSTLRLADMGSETMAAPQLQNQISGSMVRHDNDASTDAYTPRTQHTGRSETMPFQRGPDSPMLSSAQGMASQASDGVSDGGGFFDRQGSFIHRGDTDRSDIVDVARGLSERSGAIPNYIASPTSDESKFDSYSNVQTPKSTRSIKSVKSTTSTIKTDENSDK